MKKKYIISSVAALATLGVCGYAIMQYQADKPINLKKPRN